MQEQQEPEQNFQKLSLQAPSTQNNSSQSSKKVIKFNESFVFAVDPIYSINTIIGNGGYGLVVSGENLVTKEKVAIKKVPDLFKPLESAKRELREIKILRFLKHKHKNIVNLLDIMTIENKESFNEIYLVMELMQYNLKQLIRSKKKITQPMRKFILYQILDGVQYMHSADIIHRDLKPENILLNGKCQIKIIDMNLARKETINNTVYVTTRPYRAFEVLLSLKNYNKSIDIWSVGCIFAELIGRTVLFSGRDPADQLKTLVAIMGKPKLQLYEDIDIVAKTSLTETINDMPDRQKVKWPVLFKDVPDVDPLAFDLLDNMLVYDPSKRFTAQQCLNHPYLKDIREKSRVIKSQKIFDFSFDEIETNENNMRQAIYRQVQEFKEKQNMEGKNREGIESVRMEGGKPTKMRKME